MTSFEEGQQNFKDLRSRLAEGTLLTAASTEADTRAKAITAILTGVLGWPESAIDRETKSTAGYLDYRLRLGKPVLVVEAKRFGRHFTIPAERIRRTYSLLTLKSEPNHLGKAIRQVRAYADDQGIEFACVTNGAQWVVFRAITRGEPWTSGFGIVFRGLDDISDHFIEFWNLLSFEAVTSGTLLTTLGDKSEEHLRFGRALEGLLYADNALQRNALSTQLQPLITGIFRDLTGEEQDEVLAKCYLVDRKVQGLSAEVRELFNDTIPAFALRAGFQDLDETTDRSGALDADFRAAVQRGEYGMTVLLLGGVGSGKTTFIHRFFRVTVRDLVASAQCVWFYVPFTEAPLDPNDFSTFVRQRILAELSQRYPDLDTNTLETLRTIYQPELSIRRTGVWAALSAEEAVRREATFLEEKLVSATHCDAVLRYLRAQHIAVAVVVDNVDQREPSDQVRIFLLAHELCRNMDAIIFVALREESYFRADQAGAFNAYHNIRYHIASPHARRLIQRRVEYALEVSEAGSEALRLRLRSGMKFEAESIRAFLKILNDSALRHNPAIGRFADAISQGNMRLALDMFNQFMVSGSTNVDKMLEKFGEQGYYYVAEHEFIKAVMLGDFQFYKEARSPIGNLFEVSDARTASNLTSVRLLRLLEGSAAVSHPEGTGFVAIEQVLGTFDDVFGDSRDAAFHVERLLRRRIVEADNRQIDRLSGIRYLRITAAGKYMLNTLASRFCYLDLVGLDTPIWDRHVLAELIARAREHELYARVARVEWFLSYLRAEEERSLSAAARDLAGSVFDGSVVSRIESGYRQDLSRVAEKASLDRGRLENIRAEVARATS